MAQATAPGIWERDDPFSRALWLLERVDSASTVMLAVVSDCKISKVRPYLRAMADAGIIEHAEGTHLFDRWRLL